MKNVIIGLAIGISSLSQGQEFKQDFEQAKRQAQQENKNILLVFSGLEWSDNSKELDRTVWQSPDFKEYATDNLVLIKAEFPKRKAWSEPVDVNTQNMVLTEKYNRDGFFPFVVVLDKNGKVLGKTGYEDLNPKEYIKLLKSFQK
ncbi:thioredoxin family protein [Flavobacterium sp. '19STA2R22 D10 B1']|uniref:thioredoxin family protein n=1 Tax=Flavobacterium aerium TaxID=3037261 RepID=UPI00278C10BB|nr:thioredoxin family protein [Flavobacterium sp. '19STA2R22 D10 B1']